MRFGAVWLLVAGACRFDFDARAPAHDAPVDDVATADAPMTCAPLANGETVEQCLAALAAPASASDQVVYDCALSCVFGRCQIHDATGCSTCACGAYAWSTKICTDATGQCGEPLSGTGCIGGGFYAGAPVMCPSTGNLVIEGACITRYLASVGDCQ